MEYNLKVVVFNLTPRFEKLCSAQKAYISNDKSVVKNEVKYYFYVLIYISYFFRGLYEFRLTT